MTLPLLVFEGNDLSTFDTVEAACGYLEAIDVRNGEFDSFDGDGYPVELLTSGHAVVHAKRLVGAAALPHELASRLRKYLLAVGDRTGIVAETTDLGPLIAAAARWSRV